jgi:hypothetical protein
MNTLHGAAGALEQVTSLAVDIDSSATSFTVDDATQISRGVIEIGDELMYVKGVDRSANTVTLGNASFARGFRQSSATSHTTGDMVVFRPLFPRVAVKAAIQEVLQALSPDLYAVATDETQTVNPSVTTYEVPSDCDTILRAEWQSTGPSQIWVPVRRWKFDPTADTTAFASGKSMDIFDSMTPGRTIKVTYAKAPGAFSADTDTLTGTGLSEGVRDVIVYGAVARLLPNYEAARLQQFTTEQSDRDQLVQSGAAVNAAKYFMQLYLTRLDAERRALQTLYPITTHMTG